MQGQGSTSNSFPGSFYFNGGLGSDRHNVVPDALVHDGHNSMRLNGQSSSNLETQNGQFLGRDFWLSNVHDQPGSKEGRHSNELAFNPFLENISMSPGNGPVSSEYGGGPIGPSILPGQDAGSGTLQLNLDLNAVHDGRGIDASQDNGPGLSLDLSGAGRSSGNQILTSGGGSSSPVMIYSGMADYVVEENINIEGLPTDGRRRLLCKRKAPEFPCGSSSARQPGNFEQPAGVTPQNNVINNSLNAASSFNNHLNSTHSAGLVAAMQVPTPSNSPPIPNEVGQMDHFQRNTRLRRTATQQNPAPANLWTWNSSNCNVQQATGQRAVLSPFQPFTVTNSAQAPVLVNPTMQPIVRVPNSLQAPQPSQYWNGTTMSTMMIPSGNMQASLNWVNGNASFLGNIASSSRIQSGSGMHLPSSSMRFPQPNMAEQYAQRMQYFVDRYAAWGNYYCPLHSGAYPAFGDMDVSVRGGNAFAIARPAPFPLRLGASAERQGGHHPEISPAVLSQIAAQRRSRLVRNALELVRRAGGLRFEDVVAFDRSILYGMPEVDDIHDDMRLDVDNMSYEELLDLEEQIGDVCTGLSEESILANLRRRKYQSITVVPPVEAEPCCICQEDYANGEDLGKLDCGHDFHFNCIKQWLVQKNSCPVCKKTALAI